MNKEIKAELDKAVRNCKAFESARTMLFMELGYRVMTIATKCNYKPTDADGVAVVDAIEIVREHLLSVSHREGWVAPPISNLYWYTAARAVRELQNDQIYRLVKYAAPWTQIVHLLQKPKKEISQAIANLDHTHPLAIRQRHKPKGKNHYVVTDHAVDCGVTGDEGEDELQAKLEHLLSMIRARGLDYQRMVEDAVKRVGKAVRG